MSIETTHTCDECGNNEVEKCLCKKCQQYDIEQIQKEAEDKGYDKGYEDGIEKGKSEG